MDKSFPIEYGNWSFKTLVTIQGIPGIPPRTISFADCLTPRHRILVELTKNCSMTPPEIAGKTLSYTMTCTRGVSRARFIYWKRHMTGTIETRLSGPQNLIVDERIRGRYTGPCHRS